MLYKANKSFNLLLLIFPPLLTLTVLLENEPPTKGEIMGLLGFWIGAAILALAPFGMKLEVGEDSVKSFFLGFCTKEVKFTDVKSYTYDNLLLGNLGVGKGLKIYIKGRVSPLSMGERLYGKEAIEHVKEKLDHGE